MRHKDKHKRVFLRLLLHGKVITNRTFVHKSQYVKHGMGYCDSVCYK